jgi:hypothetical protein
MSEQDHADVIEQGARRVDFPAVPWLVALRGTIGTNGVIGTRRRRIVVIAAGCALLVAAAMLVTFRLAAGPRTDPALARLITEVTTVPVGTSLPGLPALPVAVSSGDQIAWIMTSPDTRSQVSGPPLTLGGKPEVLYIAAGYCPYCAMENWPLIVALSRFGQFTGLATSRTPEFEQIAPVDSWTFYGSHYTSRYLSFVPVERYSNVLVNAKANPNVRESYRTLQRLTPAQQAIFARYDKLRLTPFLDFGNSAVQIGLDTITPQLTAGKSWSQLAAALRQPKTGLGEALLNEADLLTAEFCRLTGDRPASACPPFLSHILLAS